MTYYTASNSNVTNCGNQTGLPRISMHHFSKAKHYVRSGFGLSEFTGKMFSINSITFLQLLLLTQPTSWLKSPWIILNQWRKFPAN